MRNFDSEKKMTEFLHCAFFLLCKHSPIFLDVDLEIWVAIWMYISEKMPTMKTCVFLEEAARFAKSSSTLCFTMWNDLWGHFLSITLGHMKMNSSKKLNMKNAVLARCDLTLCFTRWNRVFYITNAKKKMFKKCVSGKTIFDACHTVMNAKQPTV